MASKVKTFEFATIFNVVSSPISNLGKGRQILNGVQYNTVVQSTQNTKCPLFYTYFMQNLILIGVEGSKFFYLRPSKVKKIQK